MPLMPMTPTRFDVYCTVCACPYVYAVVMRDYCEWMAWQRKVDRTAARCPVCDRHSVIIFGERLQAETG